MNSIVTLRGVAFEFANGRELFTDMNASIGSGLSALVGPNGVGKSTLARLLAGELKPSRGRIERTVAPVYLPQRLAPEAVSVAAFLGWESEWSPWREQLLAGVDRDRLCNELSGGEWMRVRLARVEREQFLILDEPTNDLDRSAREALFTLLKDWTAGALVISHDRECLALASEVLELSAHGLKRFGGSWAAYMHQREAEHDQLESALTRARHHRESAGRAQIDQRRRQDKRNQRGAREAARGGLPRIAAGLRKRQAQATSGRIDRGTLERAESAVRDLHEAFAARKFDPVMTAALLEVHVPAQALVAEAREFNLRRGDWLYAENLNFAWRGPLRLALKGANGAGKSSFLTALLGGELETRGLLRRGRLNTLYIDQRCSILDDTLSVLDNVRQTARQDEAELRNGLARFLFTGDYVFQSVGDLSGGERLRAALAKGFLTESRPELLILDEPTNNLDLANIEFLEAVLRAYQGALIVVSHDELFLENSGVTSSLELRRRGSL